MSWRWRRRLLAAALGAAASAGAGRAQAQAVRELDLHALGVASDPVFLGVGGGYAWRDPRRTRVLASVVLGALGGTGVAGRADIAWHFLLDPRKRQGSAVYGGGGLSVQAGAGQVKPYVLLVLGAENAPGGSGGSYVEVGVGGGVRAVIGYRWRKQRAPER
jgi:hypothetical protein